jgi:hypothetical protein
MSPAPYVRITWLSTVKTIPGSFILTQSETHPMVWYGDSVRKVEDWLTKRLLNWRTELVGNKMRRGRTREKWLDVVEWDAATTGVGRDLEEAAVDRIRWLNMLALLTSWTSVHLSVLRCVWSRVGGKTLVIFHGAASAQESSGHRPLYQGERPPG